ncbi:hypothetical protein [Thalassotalea fusca]
MKITLNDRNKLMEKYDISCKKQTFFCYQGRCFSNFQDALNAASLAQDVPKESENASTK